MSKVHQDAVSLYTEVMAKCGKPCVIILPSPHGPDRFNWMLVGQLNSVTSAANSFKQH